MITFRLKDLEEDKLDWLWKNVGNGGRWLVRHTKIESKVEPETNDDWGYYFDGYNGWYKICFIDEKKAMLYSLRWE